MVNSMKLNIKEETESKLLNRKRVTAMTSFSGQVPSRKEILEALTTKLSVKPEQVVIKHVYSQPGTQDAKIIAHVYDTPEMRNKLEKVLREPKKEDSE